MAPIIEGPPDDHDKRRPLGVKIGWFVALWCLSAAAVAALAYGLRALIL